jgi:formylmethanofuran dehydrogenase subunit A
MTGDGPLGYYLHNVYGTKWFSGDMEMEAGCGIAPMTYRDKSLIHSLQWAIGLEWYLQVRDPWRVVMSTDHPNGGSFLAYPQIIRLLMDSAYRREALSRVHPSIRERTSLADLDREYSLNEICIITRAAPARILGLTNKGHLGVGADADVTIYLPNDDREQMFALPKIVIKDGNVLIEDGEIRDPHNGKTLHVAPAFDPGFEPVIAEWFEQYYSLRYRNYSVAEGELDQPSQVACRS